MERSESWNSFSSTLRPYHACVKVRWDHTSMPSPSSYVSRAYARYSARLQLRLVADFSRWLTQQGLTVHELIPEHTTYYLRYRAQQQRPRSGDAAALERLLDLLRRAGAIAEPPVPLAKTPEQQYTDAFGLYLRQERALASTTVTYYLEFVRRFLRDRFADGPVALAALGAADVIGFVQRQAAGLHPKRAKLMTTALRSFLHYAHYRGDVLMISLPLCRPLRTGLWPHSRGPCRLTGTGLSAV